MPEVVLWLRVLDHSAPGIADTWWQHNLDTPHPPGVGDDVQLWGDRDGPLAPVKRRWWRPDGVIVVETVEVSVDYSGAPADPMGEDGRLRWLPWRSSGGDVTALLRAAGWEVLGDA
jgi:hypothetical protein